MYYRNMFYLAEGITVTFPLILSYKHAVFFAMLCSKASSDIMCRVSLK